MLKSKVSGLEGIVSDLELCEEKRELAESKQEVEYLSHSSQPHLSKHK